jgi:hypothetical protein
MNSSRLVLSESPSFTETKLCECGCDQPAPIATKTHEGRVKGQPTRYIHGHNPKGSLRHGLCGTPEYQAYKDARNRCNNPRNKRFKDYGGRGIRFLFTSFQDFFAEIGFRPSTKHSVDRIKNDSHYMPGNIKWSTQSEQNYNRRKSRGRRQSVESRKKISAARRKHSEQQLIKTIAWG